MRRWKMKLKVSFQLHHVHLHENWMFGIRKRADPKKVKLKENSAIFQWTPYVPSKSDNNFSVQLGA